MKGIINMKFFKSVAAYNKSIEESKKNNTVGESKELKQEKAKSQEIIKTALKGLKFFEIGDPPTSKNPIFIGEHMGGLIRADKGIMTIGVCVKSTDKNLYKTNKKIALAYTVNNELYMAEARVDSAREATKQDLEELEDLFQNRIQSLMGILGPVKFIIANIIILPEPKPHQRRKYLRVPANWTVYFKIINPSAELKKLEKEWIEEKVFESSHGYLKSQTVNVSAGGYKTVIKVQIPEKTQIDCIIEIMGKDNTKAVGRVRGEVLGCSPNQMRSNAYDMRVKYLDVSDSTTSMMAPKIDEHK